VDSDCLTAAKDYPVDELIAKVAERAGINPKQAQKAIEVILEQCRTASPALSRNQSRASWTAMRTAASS
jgi:hypothetical protein